MISYSEVCKLLMLLIAIATLAYMIGKDAKK